MVAKPLVIIVTPGTPHANNGNWRTAWRWSRMLRDRYRMIVQTRWDGRHADALIALHARRSAESVERFRAARSDGPLIVVLSGTDLYRDLGNLPETARSLEIADRVVALQDDAPRMLEARWRRKCTVIYQSARSLAHRAPRDGVLRCTVLGHLRAEKDPLTVMRAMEALPTNANLRVRHIGAGLDAALARSARQLARRDPRYRYLGALPHGLARIAVASSDLLIHPSIMEGGANAIVEAVTSGTAVLASRMSGNVGMLGREYPGYFDVGDAEGLAGLLRRCIEDRAYLASLRRACDERRGLFRPQAEARAIHALLRGVLA